MRKVVIAAGAALAMAAAPAPLAAQDEATQDAAELFEGLEGAFVVEPLTAEQQARLPQARMLVERVMPPGAIQEMMGGMFGGALGPLIEADATDPATVVTERLGYDVSPAPENAAEVAAILDPVWEERRRREIDALPDVMARMMTGIEPVIRDVMAELYAVHFTAEELTGIDAFFATPVGATYARKSFSMTSDPRFTASMMQAMPMMMGSVSTIEADMAALTADLPPERTYEDLSPAERARLAELLYISEEDLSYQLQSTDGEWTGEEAIAYPYDDASLDGPTRPAAGSAPVGKAAR